MSDHTLSPQLEPQPDSIPEPSSPIITNGSHVSEADEAEAPAADASQLDTQHINPDSPAEAAEPEPSQEEAEPELTGSESGDAPSANGDDDSDSNSSEDDAEMAALAERLKGLIDLGTDALGLEPVEVLKSPDRTITLDDDPSGGLWSSPGMGPASEAAHGSSVASASVRSDNGEDADDFTLRRPISTSTWSTNSSSVDGLNGLNGLSSPRASEIEERVVAVKEEYENRISNMVESVDVAYEKAMMEIKLAQLEKQLQNQKKRYETKVRRLRRAPDGGSPVLGEEDEELYDLLPMTAGQEALARKGVSLWRKRRRVRMAEDAFSQAVALKEANVMSRELKKGVTFQFVVVEHESPTSASESIAGGLADIDEVSDPALVESRKPTIAVKVLDRKNLAIYTWSIPKLHQRLEQMRNLLKFVDKPEYNQHFSSAEAFYDRPPPGNFSHVGEAAVGLAPLARNLPSTSKVQIYSPYTSDPIGGCRVSIKPMGVEMDTEQRSAEGAKLKVEISVDQLTGLDKAEFTAAHLQVSLSSLFGLPASDDEVFTSDPIELAHTPITALKLAQTVTITLTASLYTHLTSSFARVDIFARVRPAHLDRIGRWDEARDSSAAARDPNLDPLRNDPQADVTRIRESELVGEQHHDVMASLEVLELGEEGEYKPVQLEQANSLDNGAFFLRQGLQRKVVLSLTHSSGRAWNWKRISRVTLSNPRMLDAKGRVHAGASQGPEKVELKAGAKSKPVFQADGTAKLGFAGSWDSSAHDSEFLNRNTPSGQRVLLHLSWQIESDNLAKAVPFSMDIAVTISSRDARPANRLMTLITQKRKVMKLTNLFAVALKPYTKNKSTEVWRFNTADKFVRGEEILGDWRPRMAGSLVRDWEAMDNDRRKLAEVEGTKSILKAFERSLPLAQPESRDSRLERVIALWREKFGTQEEVSLERKPPAPVPLAPELQDLDAGEPDALLPALVISPPALPRGPALLVGSTSIVPKSDAFVCRGPLCLLRDPSSSSWRKLFCVLQRPYLHCYDSPNSSEGEEVIVVNLSAVRIEQNEDVEAMVGRKCAFGVFTHQNSYFFQAPSAKLMGDWMRAIDPSLA